MEKITIILIIIFIIIFGFSLRVSSPSVYAVFISIDVVFVAIFLGSLLNPITGFYLNVQEIKKAHSLAYEHTHQKKDRTRDRRKKSECDAMRLKRGETGRVESILYGYT